MTDSCGQLHRVRFPESRASRSSAGWLVACALLVACGCGDPAPETTAKSLPTVSPKGPNIVFIMADDLGYSAIGSYGQTRIRTPNLDELAKEGMRFTQNYAGSSVCAPSRATLFTGLHTGHAPIRANRLDAGTRDDEPLPPGTTTLLKLLQQAGYRTGCFGKWGMGRTGSSGDPNQNGCEEFYGYIGHQAAHDYYPEFLHRNGTIEYIEANEDGKQGAYSHDLIVDEALRFIERNASQRFVCYLPLTIPHFALQVPQDSLREYLGKWKETPFTDKLGFHPDNSAPLATYAAMITRMDRDVGRLRALLKKLAIERDTVVIFTSDNGDAFADKTGSSLFELTGPFRGNKGRLYEGGIRVPLIVYWPGRTQAGSSSGLPVYLPDMMPTVAEIAGIEAPAGIDGISMVPTLLGADEKQPRHPYLYWEIENRQAILKDGKKLIRTWDPATRSAEIELFDVAADPGESRDLAATERGTIDALLELLDGAREISSEFPSPFDKHEMVSFGESETLGFGKEDPPRFKFLEGFAWQGAHHIWTVVGPDSNDSVFSVRFPDTSSDVRMQLLALPFLHPSACPSHEVTVLVNGQKVGFWRIDTPEQRSYTVVIPSAVLALARDGEQVVTLRIPTASDVAVPGRPAEPGKRRALRLAKARFLRQL